MTVLPSFALFLSHVLPCEHSELITFVFPTGSGMSRTPHLQCSARQRTITTSCKASLRPLFGLPRSKKIILTHGFSRTVCAGRPRVVHSRLAALMWHLSVCGHLSTFRHRPEIVSCSDDPQMPGLIPLIRKVRPEVPIVYRSHIEIRSDLVHKNGSPQEEVWKYLWNNIQHTDLFISTCNSLLGPHLKSGSDVWLARRSPCEQVCSK